MKYIDSSVLSEDQTVAHWMSLSSQSGIAEFHCQAGYFTLEGTSVLLPTIADCAKEGARISILLGSNGGATLASHVSYLAGKLAVPNENVSLGIVKFANSLFHPKVYVFRRTDGTKTAYVGSANFTGPGVSGRNVEAGIILDTADGDDPAILDEISGRIEAWFKDKLSGLTVIGGPADIDTLLESGSLALVPLTRNRDPGEEGTIASERQDLVAARRRAIFKLPPLSLGTADPVEKRSESTALSEKEFRSLTLLTEASFHYPQGTHLGHVLSILFYFSRDRAGSPYDDKFIRLKGGFGTGRVAGYQRQVKYKLQAAIELGLITDIRISEVVSNYSPLLTERGMRLWELFEQFVRIEDITYELGDDEVFSTTMPLDAAHYVAVIKTALKNSEALNAL